MVKKAARPVAYVYIGPSLPKEALTNGSIFRGTKAEVEQYLSAQCAKHPEITELLIPVSELNTAYQNPRISIIAAKMAGNL